MTTRATGRRPAQSETRAVGFTTFRIRRHVAALACTSVSVFTASQAGAVRPFITDDARVVGDRAAQLETWLRGDRESLQHWIAAGVGPVAPLEVTLGGVYGREGGHLAYALPLVQFKALAIETVPGAGWPGLAFVVGGFGPAGPHSGGHLRPDNWDTFGYAALTESPLPEDALLLHQNVGVFVGKAEEGRKGSATWGVGLQARLFGGLHFVSRCSRATPTQRRPGGPRRGACATLSRLSCRSTPRWARAFGVKASCRCGARSASASRVRPTSGEPPTPTGERRAGTVMLP